MKIKLLLFVTVALLVTACSTKKHTVPFRTDVYLYGTIIRYDTTTFIDSSRKRLIPVTIYYQLHAPLPTRLIILNPGYGDTRNGYSSIASNLARQGYMVITIQHDIPGDIPLPTTGDIYKLSKTYWDAGVKNVLFVAARLKKKYPQLDYKKTVLIGHSNGGDIAMLIASEYPEFAKIVISLDNRRVPVPLASKSRIFSIRSSDQVADPGVLPSAEDQKKYHIKIVKVNITHESMGGLNETEDQKKEINMLISDYLDRYE